MSGVASFKVVFKLLIELFLEYLSVVSMKDTYLEIYFIFPINYFWLFRYNFYFFLDLLNYISEYFLVIWRLSIAFFVSVFYFIIYFLLYNYVFVSLLLIYFKVFYMEHNFSYLRTNYLFFLLIYWFNDKIYFFSF